jgi:hypothetical protein
MNIDILKDLTQVAGIAGLVVGALVLIFGSIIQKSIFPNLTKDQGYKIMRMIIVFSFATALIGLAGYFYLKGTGLDEMKILTIKGAVYDNETSQPVAGVTVEIEDEKGLMVYTDDEGKFFVKLKGNGHDIKEFKFVHKSFRTKYLNEQLNFMDGSQLIEFKDVFLDPKESEREITERKTNTDGRNRNSENGNASITLIYLGDIYDCALDLEIKIGNQTFRPQGNMVLLDGLNTGKNKYSISGIIYCGDAGNCNGNGSGTLNVSDGDKFYLLWDYNTCVCTLASEAEYRAMGG